MAKKTLSELEKDIQNGEYSTVEDYVRDHRREVSIADLKYLQGIFSKIDEPKWYYFRTKFNYNSLERTLEVEISLKKTGLIISW